MSAVAGIGNPIEAIYITPKSNQYWYTKNNERKKSSMRIIFVDLSEVKNEQRLLLP